VEPSGWRRDLVETAAVIPVFAALVWACIEGFAAWLVIAADDFPQCPNIQPDKLFLALVTLAVIALTVASLVLIIRRRTRLAYACVLAQVPLGFAWNAIDGGAASCLIG
jgi:hypothetical protein